MLGLRRKGKKGKCLLKKTVHVIRWKDGIMIDEIKLDDTDIK